MMVDQKEGFTRDLAGRNEMLWHIGERKGGREVPASPGRHDLHRGNGYRDGPPPPRVARLSAE